MKMINLKRFTGKMCNIKNEEKKPLDKSDPILLTPNGLILNNDVNHLPFHYTITLFFREGAASLTRKLEFPTIQPIPRRLPD